MNHILKQAERIKELENILDTVMQGVKELRSYATLPKFQGFGNDMNPADVILRTNEILDSFGLYEGRK